MYTRELSSIDKKMKEDNYFVNCYRLLIRSKSIHFLILLIEILLILLQEIDIFQRGFKPMFNNNGETIISPIVLLIKKFNDFPEYVNFIIIVLSLIIFDSLYLLLCKKDISQKNMLYKIIINLLEFFSFRIYVLFFYSLLFILTKLYFLTSFVLSLYHAYLIINNFLYNHLYNYVPEFVDYPYNKFGSIFDLYLFMSKIILSIASDATSEDLVKFCFIISFVMQIFFCFYFSKFLYNHSYLFMKNSFINKTRLSLFLAETTIVFFSFFIGRQRIFSTLYVIINFGIMLIFTGFLFFIYDPYSYVQIKGETPLENLLYYMNMANKKNGIEVLFETKLVSHYRNCSFCNLCRKYVRYRTEEEDTQDKNLNDNLDEKESLIHHTKREKKIIDLFDLLYDGKTKYFFLIKKIQINYKKYGKIILNNIYYYINFLYLIYYDYQNNDITLSLNERVILEIIKKENYIFLESNKAQINQLLLCNEFISLGKNTLNIIKKILYHDQNFYKAQKLIFLSKLLKQMKNQKYKKDLFGHKIENSNNSKNIICACSIIYEEIFNTVISNSQMPMRENIQSLEEIFNLSNKFNNIITLKVDLLGYNCKIIRAGKGLYNYINQNLYDLFPNVFRQYQINIFLNSIFTGFNKELTNFDENENKKKNNTKKIINKKEFIDINIIIYENDSEKIYFKLLALRLTPFFSNENHNYILFNGTYTFNKNTIVSEIDLSHKAEIDEKILGVSGSNLEYGQEKNSEITLKKYISWQSHQGYKLSKLFSYRISIRLYNIYQLDIKRQKKEKKVDSTKKIFKLKTSEAENNSSEEIENNKDNRIKIYEETNSISSSVQISTYSRGISSLGINKGKKDNFFKYNMYNFIQKLVYCSFLLILIVIVVEYLFFGKFQNNITNNHNSYINYRSFYRLYYQLFASILGVACIPEEIDGKNCRNFISIFNTVYSKSYPNQTFNFTEYLLIQNQILSQKIMEEKANIIKINEYIGENKYRELFNSKINNIQITHKTENQKPVYFTKETTIDFFDAILILCNSFGILTENSTNTLTQPIFFLNKSENPFSSLINQKEMTSYQEEVYKMILNYKYYSKQFGYVDSQIFGEINTKSGSIKILIFFFVNLNVFLYFVVALFIYLFLLSFNKIVISVMNYIILTIETKNEGFDFKDSFNKKINNLEVILELYKGNPLDAIQDLNVIYNEYNAYITNKNKVNIHDLNKKNLKKSEDDNFFKNQQKITQKDIVNLNLNTKYLYTLFVLIIIELIIYLIFLLLWLDYFSKKTKLFNIISKNAKIEKSCYEAINLYELMIFNNYTLPEIANLFGISSQSSNETAEDESNPIFNNFFQDLYLLFDKEKDQANMLSLFKDFEDLAEFNCINMVVTFKYEIIEKCHEILKGVDLKQKLVDICIISHITESKDIKTIFERHFQFMKNGMLSLTDFSFEGLNRNLNTTIIGRIAFFFFSTTIYIIEVTTSKPHKESIQKLMSLLKQRILITEISFIIFGIAFIFIIMFFYIYNINNFCKQIFLLRKTFNIFEMHEQ